MTAQNAPQYLLRTVGGPFPGDRMHPGPWPLPDVLPSPDGRGEYRKMSESQIAEDWAHLLRGASYDWFDICGDKQLWGVCRAAPGHPGDHDWT